MTNWIETYRGTVPPWECDVTEHFTIAYYFDRLEEAEPNLADALGLGQRWRAGGFARRLDVRFARELRAGSSFQVEGAALGLADGLRLGHRFYFTEVVPRLGAALSDGAAYRYLPRSVAYLPPPESLVAMVVAAGFSDARRHLLSGGIVQLLVGTRS